MAGKKCLFTVKLPAATEFKDQTGTEFCFVYILPTIWILYTQAKHKIIYNTEYTLGRSVQKKVDAEGRGA